MENRSGLLVDIRVAQATGIAGREVALATLEEHVTGERATVGADKATTSARSSSHVVSGGSRHMSRRR